MNEPNHPTGPEWKLLDSTLLLSAPPWMSVYRDRVEPIGGPVIVIAKDATRVASPRPDVAEQFEVELLNQGRFLRAI